MIKYLIIIVLKDCHEHGIKARFLVRKPDDQTIIGVLHHKNGRPRQRAISATQKESDAELSNRMPWWRDRRVGQRLTEQRI